MRVYLYVIAFTIAVLGSSPIAAAATIQLSANTSIASTLDQARKLRARVEVGLRSGAAYRGSVHSVNEERVVLENLELRENFSVVIRLSEIATVETRTKGN